MRRKVNVRTNTSITLGGEKDSFSGKNGGPRLPQDVTDGNNFCRQRAEATSGKTLEVIVKEISVDKGSDLQKKIGQWKRKTETVQIDV